MRSVLDGRRGELAEMEQRLARIEEEAAKADAEHSRWTERPRSSGPKATQKLTNCRNGSVSSMKK